MTTGSQSLVSRQSEIDKAAELKNMKNRFLRVAGFILQILIIFVSQNSIEAQNSKVKFTDERNDAVRNNTNSLEREIFEIINQTRAKNGLKGLIWSDAAAQIARLHSSNMASYGFFSHQGVDGMRVGERAESAGLRDWEMIGENIAYNSGFENPAERAVYGWMNSAGHRKNILRGNWKETGIGIAVSPGGKFFFTQVFLKRR